MSASSTAITNPLRPSLDIPYTGTLEQPDTVSIFFKSGNDVSIKDENVIATMSHSPLNYFHNLHSTVLRIQEALRKIFRGDGSDQWNALKNLGRGIVQLVPFAGNAALYLYDRIKTNFYIHPKIKSELASENGSILGIAFDGKIISTFSLQELNSCLVRNYGQTHRDLEKPLVTLNYIWSSLLVRAIENDSPSTRYDLALKLASQIKRV